MCYKPANARVLRGTCTGTDQRINGRVTGLGFKLDLSHLGNYIISITIIYYKRIQNEGFESIGLICIVCEAHSGCKGCSC